MFALIVSFLLSGNFLFVKTVRVVGANLAESIKLMSGKVFRVAAIQV